MRCPYPRVLTGSCIWSDRADLCNTAGMGRGNQSLPLRGPFMNRVWSMVLAIAACQVAFGAISPALAGDAPAQSVIFDLNRDLPPTDARFDCSRGRECRYLPSNFGPFHIT